MKKPHTKGPWIAHNKLILGNGLDVWVAKSTAVDLAVNEANALLIAAAPDLFDAAEAALAVMQGGGRPVYALAKLIAAIAKAGGSTS